MSGIQLVPGGFQGGVDRVKNLFSDGNFQKQAQQNIGRPLNDLLRTPVSPQNPINRGLNFLSKNITEPINKTVPYLSPEPIGRRMFNQAQYTGDLGRQRQDKINRGEKPTFGEEAIFGLNTIGTMLPGIDDAVIGGYDYLKARSAGQDRNRALESFKGNRQVGGGEYIGAGDAFLKQDTPAADLLNMAELPLMLFGGVKANQAIKRLDDVNPKAFSGLFDKNTVDQNERLLRLMKEQADNVGDTKKYKPVINELETILRRTRPDIDQPGYIEALSGTTRVNQKVAPKIIQNTVENVVPTTEAVENVAPIAKVVDNVAPTTKAISPDNVSEVLKTYRKTGSPHIKTPDVWNQSVTETTKVLNDKYAPLDNLLKQIDLEDGKQHLADIIQNNAKPKSQLYEDASKLYKVWSNDLADIEGLSDIGKLRKNYYAAYSNEQIYAKQLREMAGGTAESLFELPQLKTKTDLSNIGDASLVDTLRYRNKAASLNAHSGATMDVSPAGDVIRKFQKHVASQMKKVEAGGNYKVYDLIGDFQKQFKGQKKIVEAKLTTVFGKATHTFDMVMQKIAKSGGEELNKSYQMIRESNIIISSVLKKMEGLNFDAKMGLLRKYGMDIDEGLVKYLIDKKGMSEESIINMLLNQKFRKNAIRDFIYKTGEYEFTDHNVKNVLNDFANSFSLEEIAKDSMLSKLTNQVVSTVATAHLGLNPVTATKQLFEITRAPVYAGFKNTVKGVMKALNPFSDVNRKYGLKEFESNYVPKDTTLLKGAWDKFKNVMFFPMQKMELFKNRVFALSMEEALKNSDMKQIDKLHKIRDVLFGGGNVAHKLNKPLILKGSAGKSSSLGDALGLYFQFSMKNFDIKLNELQHGEYKKFGKLLASDLTTAALTSVVFGYPLSWALENLLPVGNPVLAEVFTKLYDNFKQHGQSVESGKESDKTKSRYYLNRSLAQNILPAGTQGVRDYEASEIMKKGADYSPVGYKRWEAPTEPLEKAKMFAFGKTSTKNYKEYRKELDESGWQPPETPKGIEGIKLAGKGALDYFTGFGSSKAKASSKTPAMTKQDMDVAKENITFGLDSGKIPDKAEIQSGLFEGKTAASKTIEDRMDVYKQLKTVINNEYYTEEQKQAVIEASGASKEDAEYYGQASKDIDVKLQELLPEIDKMSNEDMFKFLLAGRKEIADKQLVTSDMITYLYDKGYISKNQKKALSALKYDQVKDEFYYSRDYSSGGGSSKKLSYSQALKLFKIDLPKYSELKSVKNFLSSNSSGTTQTDRSGDTLLSDILRRKAVTPNIKFG